MARPAPGGAERDGLPAPVDRDPVRGRGADLLSGRHRHGPRRPGADGSPAGRPHDLLHRVRGARPVGDGRHERRRLRDDLQCLLQAELPKDL